MIRRVPRAEDLSRAELRAAHCWFDVDRVPKDPETTQWKRRARARQAAWREARGFPRGWRPYEGASPTQPATPMGSRVELGFARETGANFLAPAALEAAAARVGRKEPREMLAADRLWADLLSSMPLCFNLFGEAAADPSRARAALALLAPRAPQGEVSVLFEHSPGRGDPGYLGNLSAFDAAMTIDGGAILGIETKYHEHARPERPPRPSALARYVEVTERSGAFADGWRERVIGTALQQIWQDHLLVLAMLQHPSATWTWGRFVLLYPAENPSFARVASEYRDLVRHSETFAAFTLEELVTTPGVLSRETRAAFIDRYLIAEVRPDSNAVGIARSIRAELAGAARSGEEIHWGILTKAASHGPGIHSPGWSPDAACPELAGRVRRQLVRAVLRAPPLAAIEVLEAFDFYYPRGWTFDFGDDEPYTMVSRDREQLMAPCVAAWSVCLRAAGVTDEETLECLREEVRGALSGWPPDVVSWYAGQVDAVASATRPVRRRSGH